jgi:hypothetical protein
MALGEEELRISPGSPGSHAERGNQGIANCKLQIERIEGVQVRLGAFLPSCHSHFAIRNSQFFCLRLLLRLLPATPGTLVNSCLNQGISSAAIPLSGVCLA